MNAQATIYGVISTLEKYPIEEAKAMLFRMAQDLEVTVTQRAKLESSSRADMLTEPIAWTTKLALETSKNLAGTPHGVIDACAVNIWGENGVPLYARARFSAPPAIDVEEIMDLLLAERTRGVDLCYKTMEKFEASFKSKEAAGNTLAFIDREISNECRILGNVISGGTALSHAVGETRRDRIVAEYGSRLLSLLSPGNGDGVTVGENKAPRS